MPIDVSGYIVESESARQQTYDGLIQDGLVLHLDAALFNTIGGTTWYDLSGNSNHGTLTNGPAFSVDNGGAFNFDGVNDYANIPSTTPDTDDFTIFFAYKLTGASGRGGLFERKPTSPYNGVVLGQNADNDWSFYVSGTSNFSNNIQLSYTYPTLNSWYVDTAVYYNNNSISIYRNGVFVSSTSGVSQGNLSSQGSRTNFLIANRDLTSAYLPCVVSTVTVYNRALTATEIQENYSIIKTRYGL